MRRQTNSKAKTGSNKKLPREVRRPADLPATYGALSNVRNELISEIASVRTALKGEIDSVRTELKGEIDSVRTELKGEIDSVRTELKGEIDSVRTELKGEIGSVRTELKSEMTRQFAAVNSTLEQIKATNSRMLGLIEEQTSINRASFEGAEAVRIQQDVLAKRVDALEEFQHDISKRLKTT